MNAIELLIQQHEETQALFDRFEETSDQDMKQQIVSEIISDLQLHTAIEEGIFYPAVRERLGLDDELDEDLEEHHVVEMLLDELEGMSPGDERYDAKVEVLSELVEHHVDEEENDLFPTVRDTMDDNELQELGDRMQSRSEQLASEADTKDATKEELYRKAQELNVAGRSQMSKRQLANAVRQRS